MYKYLRRIISIILIFSLFFPRGFTVVDVVYSQSGESPTTVPSAESPASSEKPASAPKAPSDPKPPSDFQNQSSTAQSSPTSPPALTSGESTSSLSQPESASGAVSSVTDPTPTDTSNTTAGTAPTGGTGQSSGSTQDTGSPDSNSSSSGGDISPKSNSDSGSINDPANILTGPFSNNTATEKNQSWEEVLNQNMAILQNKIDAISNSGFNYANMNTLEGKVFSGDALASLNLLNKLNSNMTGLGGFSVFNIYDTYLGDLNFKFADGGSNNSFANASNTVSKNAATGPGSTNNGLADSSFTVKEANGNNAGITNDINLAAVSGKNSASYNTGEGYVKTGNATALGNIINMANTNLNVSKWLIGVVNIFGTLAGNIVLPKNDGSDVNTETSGPVLAENSNTGPLSTNNATYTNNETTNTTNNNTAGITTSLNVSANTGSNTASVNTGGGIVSTGMSDAAVSNSTIANTNTVNEEGTVWMVIVNEMGKWVGHIIGAPWGSTAASNSLPISQTGGGSGNQAFSTLSQNSATGPLSTNNATNNISSDTSLTNNNTATISNNITANADSGNNESVYNTGAGQIDTGNAKVGLNLVNMVNTNVVAKKFVAVLVNVLGNFLGNVVTPEGQASQQANNNFSVTGGGSDNSYNPQPTTYNTSGQVLNAGTQPTSTPSVYQTPAFNSASANIGGTDTNQSIVNPAASTNQQLAYENNYYGQTYPSDYVQAVNQVQQTKNRIITQVRILSQGPGSKNIVLGEAGKFKRGLFISPAFAKATETSFAGILLGGASIKINESWLTVVPIALVLIFIRRRRRINIGKYLNAILEIVL